MAVSDRVRGERLDDRYVVAAGLIVASIIATAFAGDHRLGQISFLLIESVTLVVIMQASRVSPRTLRIVTVLVTVAFAGSALTVSLDRASAGPAVVGAILALGAPVVIVRRVRDHARIDLNTVAASLCVYLLAGMFFAYLYRFLDILDGPFFTQTGDPRSADFVYFSFTTLTTLGYGDFTARADLGRMLAVAEALLGQLYLVSVVALLVGHFGRERGGTTADRGHDHVEDEP